MLRKWLFGRRRQKYMRSDRYTDGSSNQPARRKPGRHRILLLVILLLLAVNAGIVAYSYRSASDSLDVTFTEAAPTVEVGGRYDAMSYVSSSEGDVAPSEEYLDADTPGTGEITYTVSKELYGGLLSVSDDRTLSYTVIDSEPPLMIWSGDGTVLEQGTEFDINQVIGYGDNADPEPQVKVDGSVDMNTAGSYPLHVTVTDASGNATDWDLTVKVAASVPSDIYAPEPTDFADFVSKYKGTGKTFGIDVSTWQGDVDYKAAADAGAEFVMIRIGYSSEGEVTEDGKFSQNIARAREAGLKVGIYLYSYDNNEEDVRASAHWITDKLAGAKLDLPVVFDWEDFGHFQVYGMSLNELNGLYDVFADEISSAGYDCMLYGSKTYLEKIWQDTDVRPVWLAHYAVSTDYKDPYRMWQASSTGHIPGIDGYVDMDILFE